MRTSGAWLQTSGGSSCSASHWSPCLFLGFVSFFLTLFFGLKKDRTCQGRTRAAHPLPMVIHATPGWTVAVAHRLSEQLCLDVLCRCCAHVSGSKTTLQDPPICCRQKAVSLQTRSNSKWLMVQNGLNWFSPFTSSLHIANKAT